MWIVGSWTFPHSRKPVTFTSIIGVTSQQLLSLSLESHNFPDCSPIIHNNCLKRFHWKDGLQSSPCELRCSLRWKMCSMACLKSFSYGKWGLLGLFKRLFTYISLVLTNYMNKAEGHCLYKPWKKSGFKKWQSIYLQSWQEAWEQWYLAIIRLPCHSMY